MTTTVTSITTFTLTHNGYNLLSSSIGLAIIGLLAFVLLLRELVPILRGGNMQLRVRGLEASIVPLLLTFAIVILARLADLLR
jgi:hypothetical protein